MALLMLGHSAVRLAYPLRLFWEFFSFVFVRSGLLGFEM